MSVDIERLREHLTSGKRFEIYGEGTLEASAVLNAAPGLLDEIERLTKNALKASNEAGRLKLENNQWNDTDCNTCPLRTWSECDEICISKTTMAERMAELANDIDIKLDALLKAESDRDYWKAKAEALERAIKSEAISINDSCKLCVNHKRGTCDCPGYSGWQFDQARFLDTTDK